MGRNTTITWMYWATWSASADLWLVKSSASGWAKPYTSTAKRIPEKSDGQMPMPMLARTSATRFSTR